MSLDYWYLEIIAWKSLPSLLSATSVGRGEQNNLGSGNLETSPVRSHISTSVTECKKSMSDVSLLYLCCLQGGDRTCEKPNFTNHHQHRYILLIYFPIAPPARQQKKSSRNLCSLPTVHRPHIHKALFTSREAFRYEIMLCISHLVILSNFEA